MDKDSPSKPLNPGVMSDLAQEADPLEPREESDDAQETEEIEIAPGPETATESDEGTTRENADVVIDLYSCVYFTFEKVHERMPNHSSKERQKMKYIAKRLWKLVESEDADVIFSGLGDHFSKSTSSSLTILYN